MTLDTKIMDDKSWQLLVALQENARLSYAELGRRVSLTLPAVAERVHKMEDAGIIEGYRAEVNPARIGMPISAFIRISIVGNVFTRITKVVQELPEVVECHRSTGADSFILKVQVRSVEHMEALIDKLTPFGTTSTSVVLSSPVKRRTLSRTVAAEELRPRAKRTPRR
jgi:Lrp/AsnC family transcriptional regulator, leucine-responsive regulatory protein